MANAVFTKYKQALLSGGANIPDLDSATIKAAIIDTAIDTPNTGAAGDEYLSDVSAAVIATSAALANKTVVAAVFDADDVTVTDPGGGATGEALILYADTGVAATSRLLAYLDTGVTGLPITLDGVDDLIRWNASGIFAL
jgi:Ethanolamine utilization protein EutJ (predicted chaperonin)